MFCMTRHWCGVLCPKTLVCVKNDFSCSSHHNPASLPAKGVQWAASAHTTFVSGLLQPSPHLHLSAFLRPLFAMQRELLELNKRCPDCRLHVRKARGFSSMASCSKASVNWNPANGDFFLHSTF